MFQIFTNPMIKANRDGNLFDSYAQYNNIITIIITIVQNTDPIS